MTLKIGRFGSDIAVNNPGSASWDGGSLALSGVFVASSLEDAAALRDQLEGHVNNADEPFVPVNLDSVDPRLSGFYVVEDAKVDATKVSLAQAGVTKFAYQYSVKLRPVPKFASPLFESLIAPVQKNSLGFGTFIVGLPVGAYSPITYNLDLGGVVSSPSATSALRASADGGSVYVIDGVLAALFNTNYVWSISWGVPFGTYYSGSCAISAGPNLRAVAGQDAPNYTQWRISNGLVRVTYVPSSSDIDVSHWDGATWDTKRYRFWCDSTQLPAWKQWQILRNSAECSTIRLFAGAGGSVAARYVDLTLRRGSMIVEGIFTRLDGVSAGSINVQVGLVTPEASANAIGFTTVNMGVKASGTDAQSNRYVLFGGYSTGTTPALSIDTANSRISIAETGTVRPLPFGITSLVNYATVAAPNREADLASQFTADTAEMVAVIS